MHKRNYFAHAFVGAAMLLAPMATTALAAQAAAPPIPGVPVYPYDIKDRPYQVLGEVKAGVRKATIFSKSADQKKIYRELWERGQKLGADAVIKAGYGESHVTAFSWGSTSATGVAIKFTGPAVADAASTATPPPGAPTADAASTPPAAAATP